MRQMLIAVGLACCGLTATALAQTAPPAAEFVAQATASNQFEIASSKMALDESDREDIEAFANTMIVDHEAAGEELAAAAKAAGVPMDPEAPLPSPKAEQLAQLDDTEDEAFDPLYLQLQLAAHQEAVALFEAYAKGGDDETLKAFAQKTLPTLQKHLEHVEMLSKQ